MKHQPSLAIIVIRRKELYLHNFSDINIKTTRHAFSWLTYTYVSNELSSYQASSSTTAVAPDLMSDPPKPPAAPKAPPPPLPAFWRKSGTSCCASERILTRSDAIDVSKSAPLEMQTNCQLLLFNYINRSCCYPS